MGKWPTHREKTLRAFRVYTELMDTAAWVRSWMRGPLEAYDLSPQGFRMLLMLYENGPTRCDSGGRTSTGLWGGWRIADG